MKLHYKGMQWSFNLDYNQIENLAHFAAGTVGQFMGQQDVNVVWLSPNVEDIGLEVGDYDEDQINAWLQEHTPKPATKASFLRSVKGADITNENREMYASRLLH